MTLTSEQQIKHNYEKLREELSRTGINDTLFILAKLAEIQAVLQAATAKNPRGW